MTDLWTPAFPVSVPIDLYRDVEKIAGGEFADSYLYGAILHNDRLLPRTVTAWERLRDHPEIIAQLKRDGIELVKPEPYRGEPAWRQLGLPSEPKLKGMARQ